MPLMRMQRKDSKTIMPNIGFKWRDKNGGLHEPSKMKTSHLYFTLRMVWNHAAPEHLKIIPYRKYTFNKEIYTDKYITKAVKEIALELFDRDDLKAQWIIDIQFMAQNFEEWKHGKVYLSK